MIVHKPTGRDATNSHFARLAGYASRKLRASPKHSKTGNIHEQAQQTDTQR